MKIAKDVWSIDEGDLSYEDEAMRAHAKKMIFPIGEPNDKFAQYFTGKSFWLLCLRHRLESLM